VNDRQLGERLRRALEAERPPSVSAAEVRQRAGAQQQRRELEEIRRHFAEVGRQTGSAFAPTTPEDDRLAAVARPFTSPLDRPRRPPWQWAVAVVLVFLLGAGFGALLSGVGPNDRPAASAASPPTATAPAPATTQAPQVWTVPSVPQVCLETARTGDQVIAMLTRAKRNPSLLSEALKEYSLASQACRKAASP
jgi:hypothetical protein